jgi:hypothetical protein
MAWFWFFNPQHTRVAKEEWTMEAGIFQPFPSEIFAIFTQTFSTLCGHLLLLSLLSSIGLLFIFHLLNEIVKTLFPGGSSLFFR